MEWVELQPLVVHATNSWWLMNEKKEWLGGVGFYEGRWVAETNAGPVKGVHFDTLEEAQAYVMVISRMEG